MNYPGGNNKNYTKAVNYGNRGMNLEELLNDTNAYYLEKNKAVIYKKPTPIQITESKIIKGKLRITDAFFKTPSTLDYNGLYRGKYVDFDAKETKNSTSFPLNNIHEHQLKHIEKVIEHGGIAFLIISMNGLYYYLDGHDIINFIKNNERKSIPYNFIKESGYEIKLKLAPKLDYLKVIDLLYFKES